MILKRKRIPKENNISLLAINHTMTKRTKNAINEQPLAHKQHFSKIKQLNTCLWFLWYQVQYLQVKSIQYLVIKISHQKHFKVTKCQGEMSRKWKKIDNHRAFVLNWQAIFYINSLNIYISPTEHLVIIRYNCQKLSALSGEDN